MFLHFGMSTFDCAELSKGDKPSPFYAPDQLDVDGWGSVARDAGMRYAVLTTKHGAKLDTNYAWPTDIRAIERNLPANPNAKTGSDCRWRVAKRITPFPAKSATQAARSGSIRTMTRRVPPPSCGMYLVATRRACNSDAGASPRLALPDSWLQGSRR